MNRARVMTLIWLLTLVWLCVPPVVRAHCDTTMDGPAVKDARDALATGDVTPHALETGSVDSLVSLVTDKAAHDIRGRFLRI